METWMEMVITILVTFIASSGFWGFVQSRSTKKSAERQILLGLAHDAIIVQCDKYIERGYIYDDEYKDLNDYLYKPYVALGGDGSAERAVKQVQEKVELRYRKY